VKPDSEILLFSQMFLFLIRCGCRVMEENCIYRKPTNQSDDYHAAVP
jgi:hypothetical protein